MKLSLGGEPREVRLQDAQPGQHLEDRNGRVWVVPEDGPSWFGLRWSAPVKVRFEEMYGPFKTARRGA